MGFLYSFWSYLSVSYGKSLPGPCIHFIILKTFFRLFLWIGTRFKNAEKISIFSKIFIYLLLHLRLHSVCDYSSTFSCKAYSALMPFLRFFWRSCCIEFFELINMQQTLGYPDIFILFSYSLLSIQLGMSQISLISSLVSLMIVQCGRSGARFAFLLS